MNIHKRIIGICWIIFGGLIISLLAVNFPSVETRVAVIGSLAGLTFLGAGFVLLANLPRSHLVCLPAAALSLFSIPIGTVVGVYYLWYYFKREALR